MTTSLIFGRASFVFGAALVVLWCGGTRGVAEPAEGSWRAPRVEWTPGAGLEVMGTVAGEEVVVWRHGAERPRPFFFPLRGPSGASLTRMGHPGAPDHDHHQSVWFAHADVGGVNFWGNSSGARIRQTQWLAYEDGEEEARMAVLLAWEAPDGAVLMEQEMIAALRPLEGGERELELQATFRPGGGRLAVTLGKTNFGLLAVRVAKSLSEHFGGGRLRNSEGAEGELAIFGQPARWVDYSGPVAVGQGSERTRVLEGITFFDHPSNPRYPTAWHVRADGWMGASFCLNEGWEITQERPLRLRYLLHAHAGEVVSKQVESRAAAFAQRGGLELRKVKGHRHFEIHRVVLGGGQ